MDNKNNGNVKIMATIVVRPNERISRSCFNLIRFANKKLPCGATDARKPLLDGNVFCIVRIIGAVQNHQHSTCQHGI